MSLTTRSGKGQMIQVGISTIAKADHGLDAFQDDMPWSKDAACKGADPDIFFTDFVTFERGDWKAYCDDCPVRQACLDHAREYHEQGIWGGKYFGQRSPMGTDPQAPKIVSRQDILDVIRDNPDWTVQEYADHLGFTHSAMKKHVARARKELAIVKYVRRSTD